MNELIRADQNINLVQAARTQQRVQAEMAEKAAQIKNSGRIEQAAQEFEAVFLSEMLKPMFKEINEADPMFGGGNGEEVFNGMMVQEYGKMMAQSGGIGIAEHVRAELIKIQKIPEQADGGNGNSRGEAIMATDKLITDGNAKARTIVLSGDPNKAMQQMMDTINSLRTVYIEENAALGSADTQKFMGLQDKKIAAARDYQACTAQMIERRDELQHIDNALKQQLLNMQEEFAGIMAENLKAIDHMRRGVQRLNDRIMTSAREAARTKNVNYSAKGKLHTNERSVSIGLSEQA